MQMQMLVMTMHYVLLLRMLLMKMQIMWWQ